MRSSFLGLEMSKRSIQLSQKALDITAHNMSNVGVDGYSRQRVDTSSMYLKSYANWQTKMSRLSLGGQGSQGIGIARIRDSYIDKRYRDLICSTEQYGKTGEILSEIETIFDNVEDKSLTGTDGLMESLDAIIKSISNAAVNAPDVRELTSVVRNNMENFCAQIRSADQQLNVLRDRNLWELEASVDYVNELISKITDYNERIVKEYTATEFGSVYRGDSVSRYGPLELMDQRDVLVDELAGYMNIHVNNNPDGSYKIAVGDVTIIDGTANKYLAMRNFDDLNSAQILFSDGTSANSKIKSGVLESYISVLNGNGLYASSTQTGDYGIPYYKSALDAFANKFAQLINEYNGNGALTQPDGTVVYDDYTRCLIGSRDDLYNKDAKGKNLPPCLERVTVTAATIRVTDEWMLDEGLIAQVKVSKVFKPLATFELDTTSAAYGAAVSGAAAAATAAENADEVADGVPLGTYAGRYSSNVGYTYVNGSPVYTYNVTATSAGTPPVTTTVSSTPSVTPAVFSLDAGGNPVLAAGANSYGGYVYNTYAFDTDGMPYLTNADGSFASYTVDSWNSVDLDGTALNKFVLMFDETTKFGRASDFEGSLVEYLQFLSNRCGQQINYFSTQHDAYQTASENLLDARDAVSAVNETEEGINMMTFTKWFNASSRIMTALDDCLDRVINNMGRVGL